VHCRFTRCPQLHFAKERESGYLSNLEALFDKADYGENYTSQPKAIPKDFFKPPYSDH